MKYIVEIFTNDEGIHTINVYRKTWYGRVYLQTGRDTRSQYALTKAFKGLLSSK